MSVPFNEILAQPCRYGYLMEGSARVDKKWNQAKGWHDGLTHGKLTIMAYNDPDRVYTDRVARFSDDLKVTDKYRVGNSKDDNNDQGGNSIDSAHSLG